MPELYLVEENWTMNMKLLKGNGMSLQRFEITETRPTPLLSDFEIFLGYLRANSISLTPKKLFLKKKYLYELNKKMYFRISRVSENSNQDRYPLLHLFYHLVLSGKLFQIDYRRRSRRVLEPTDRLQLYERLNWTEKYFFLLETFWMDVNWRKLQGGYFGYSPIRHIPWLLDFLSKCQPGKKIQLRKCNVWMDRIFAHTFAFLEYFLLYFAYFGFWHATLENPSYGNDVPKRWCQPESIRPTKFGVMMASILKEARPILSWNLPYRREIDQHRIFPDNIIPTEYFFLGNGEEDYKLPDNRPSSKRTDNPKEPFFKAFTPLFPEHVLRQTLSRDTTQFEDGIYTFKVALGRKIWRRIKIAADNTLEDLHLIIQEAFSFDNAHLYSFFLDGVRWSFDRISCPEEGEGISADEVQIGELGLSIGQDILYLFDYGDEWCFSVQLEHVDKKKFGSNQPQIVARRGESPPQYG